MGLHTYTSTHRKNEKQNTRQTRYKKIRATLLLTASQSNIPHALLDPGSLFRGHIFGCWVASTQSHTCRGEGTENDHSRGGMSFVYAACFLLTALDRAQRTTASKTSGAGGYQGEGE